MEQTPDMFGSVLTEIANGPQLGTHGAPTKALMQRFAEKGLTLSHLAGPRMMNRSIHTLREHAREFGLSFPDYVPLAQRPVVVLTKSGDIYEVIGNREKIAAALGISADDDAPLTVPASDLEQARDKLHAAWFVVRIVKNKAARNSKKVTRNGQAGH